MRRSWDGPRLPSPGTLVVAAVAMFAGCATAGDRPLTDAERAAIADTIRQLSRETARAVDTGECEAAAAAVGEGFVLAAQGRTIELGSREDMLALCGRWRQERLSAHEEIDEQTVQVLDRDAAWVLTRSVYTVTFRDGRTSQRPQVVTSVVGRGADGWRLVHLHESWPTEG